MSGGPLGIGLGRGRRRQQPVPVSPGEAAAVKENREIKDKIAALCKQWRRDGSPSHAAELERLMGWVPAGDPLTGCLPVIPPGE